MTLPTSLHQYRVGIFPRLADYDDTATIADVGASIGWPQSVAAPITFDETLNEVSSAEFEVDLYHPLVTRANFGLMTHDVFIFRDEDDDPEPVWGGRLWVADVKDHTVRFKAYGWAFDLSRREVSADYASTVASPKDVYRIARDLIFTTDGEDDLGLTFFADYTSTTRGITRALTVCAEERAKVLDLVSDLETDLDWSISPQRVVRFYSHKGVTSPTVTLDAAVNVSAFAYIEDATQVVTEVAGVGSKEDCATPAVYVTTDSGAVAEFGLLQDHVLPDHPEDQDAVEREADETLRLGVVPRLQPEVATVGALAEDYLAVADPANSVDFYDVEVGDVVNVEASRGASGGWGEFSAEFRVLTKRVEVSRPGVERITYGLDQVTP